MIVDFCCSKSTVLIAILVLLSTPDSVLSWSSSNSWNSGKANSRFSSASFFPKILGIQQPLYSQQHHEQQQRLSRQTIFSRVTVVSLSQGENNDNVDIPSTDNDGMTSSEVKQEKLSATDSTKKRSSYDLGLGKNRPFGWEEEQQKEKEVDPSSTVSANVNGDIEANQQGGITGNAVEYWNGLDPVIKPLSYIPPYLAQPTSHSSSSSTPFQVDLPPRHESDQQPKRTRRMVARDQKSQLLRKALWDETHYRARGAFSGSDSNSGKNSLRNGFRDSATGSFVPRPTKFYPDIDMSIPESVYSEDGSVDLVWDLLRWEALEQAQREPLLLSFLHSTILNHRSLESSLSFLLANRLQSPAMMISTQLQSLIYDSLETCPRFRRYLRADIMAVRDRDPACNYLPDVFLYFKGFHALQSHRVAHRMWNSGKQVLAQYLQSQVSQIFQIDIHPNATLGSGIMLDHGTGIVIGETATVGHNCSILHHVTLGGSGKKGVIRHPQVGDGVLLGAGATVLGPVTIGEGTQVGAGTLVISDLPPHCVAVGVPARIIGSFVDVTTQPSIGMNQMIEQQDNVVTFASEGI